MSQVFTPPSKAIIPTNKPTLFLGGSIEMGHAFDWQSQTIRLFEEDDYVILNPRRPDWDSTWIQSAGNPQFDWQVNWELNGIDAADCVIMYMDENTKSPITMMELGYCAGKVYAGDIAKTVAYCRDGFWRKGNVDIISSRNHIQVFDGDLASFYGEVRDVMLRNFNRRTTLKNQGWDYGRGPRPPA
jgi:Nucleoside 2-deoxyribosyltransferase like